MIFCPKCSFSNDEGQKFCFHCGTVLVGELEKFLAGAGLGELLPVFEANDIRDLKELMALGSDDLKDLLTAGGSRIPYGDMIKLRKAIEGLKQPFVHIPPVAQEEREIDRLQKKASQGDVSAMHELGELYSVGSEGFEEDHVEAAAWYRKAAEKGHAAAQYQYGEALYYGRGVAEDERDSAKWLRMATRQGHPEAKKVYNERVEEGRIPYLLDSAEQGNGESQYRLGCLFFHGEQGHPVDKEQAASWYRKASAQGVAAAQHMLGVMYLKGDGIRQDVMEGRRLIEAAAARGHGEAVQMMRTIAAEEEPVQAPDKAPDEAPGKPPEKQGGSGVGTIMLVVVVLMMIAAPLVYRFLPKETQQEVAVIFLPKEYQQASPTPTTTGFGGTPASSSAGIVSLESSSAASAAAERLAREKAEAEQRALEAQRKAEQAEREKQEALQRAQRAERSAAQAAQSQQPISSNPGWLGVDGSNGEGHLVNGRETLINGALVTGVVPGSPADRSGIVSRDLIISVDGVEVGGFEQMHQQIVRHRAGDVVSLGIVHNNGQTETVSVRLGSPGETSDEGEHPSSSQQQLPDGFSNFLKQYVRDHGSNNPWDIAYDYAPTSYNCYANGRVSRAFIADDVGKLIRKYPQRTYSNVQILGINVVSSELVRVQIRFNYQYSGTKAASGTSTEDLEIALISGKWQVTSFTEQVNRR